MVGQRREREGGGSVRKDWHEKDNANASVSLSLLIGVEYEEQLVLAEVLWHAERLELGEAVTQNLADARLRCRSLG